jgi:hypothetical protein
MNSKLFYAKSMKEAWLIGCQVFILVKVFRRLLPSQDEFLLPFEVTNEIMMRNQITLRPASVALL